MGEKESDMRQRWRELLMSTELSSEERHQLSREILAIILKGSEVRDYGT
jgi:hypothetical protein